MTEKQSIIARAGASVRKRWAARKRKTWRQRIVGAFTGPRFAAFVVMFALLGARMFEIAPFPNLQLRGFDTYQRVQPRETLPEAPLPGVVIVDIDERSLKEIGQWPWPRTLLADLVNNLMAYGALV